MTDFVLAQRMGRLDKWMDEAIAARQAELYPGRSRPKAHVIGDAMVVIDPNSRGAYPSQNLNRVQHLGTENLLEESHLDEIVDRYAEAQVDRFFVYVSPSDCAQDLESWLQKRGLRQTNVSSVLARPTAAVGLPFAGLKVTRVTHDDQADLLRVLTCHGEQVAAWPEATLHMVGVPGFITLLAWQGSTPISTGSLYVYLGLGYLGNGMTVPSYRSLGGQSTLIAARTALAYEMGCDWVACETYRFLEASYKNLIRCGFEERYVRTIYRWEREE